MYFLLRQSQQPMSSSYRTGTCALLTMLLAVASSIRLHAETGTSGNLVGPEVMWTESPMTNQTTATTAVAANMFGGRHGDRRRHVIRGEREAAVITRLPQMKTEVCQAERLEQTVKERGCLPRTVVNRYCYGQCNSFFIPRAATLSPDTARQHNGKQHHQPETSNGFGSETSHVVLGPEPALTGYGRRRPVRTGSATTGTESSFPSMQSSSSSPSSSSDAVEMQWLAFKSCSFCRPKRVAWITVGLNCPRRRPSYRRRRVQIIKECACTALTLD